MFFRQTNKIIAVFGGFIKKFYGYVAGISFNNHSFYFSIFGCCFFIRAQFE